MSASIAISSYQKLNRKARSIMSEIASKKDLPEFCKAGTKIGLGFI